MEKTDFSILLAFDRLSLSRQDRIKLMSDVDER